MSAIAISTMTQPLQKLFAAQQANEEGASDLCLTFETAGNDSAWVQVVSNTINFGYTGEDEPLYFLSQQGVDLLPDCAVIAWDKGLSATLTHTSQFGDDVAVFVDAILWSVHGLDDEFEIEVKAEQL
ncbi:MAG: hypothetical protein WCT04_02160 [Planctomycetota bacterium]